MIDKGGLEVGDVVALTSRTMSARPGALAVVTAFGTGNAGDNYMYIRWIRRPNARGQNDGGYYPYMFTLVWRPPKTLVKEKAALIGVGFRE
jgi:hypothetical protein